MYEKQKQRLINVYDLERHAVVKEDGSRYVPWLRIAEVPTAMMEERHGQWINKLDYLGSRSGYKFCSVCSGWMPASSTDYPYCPHCGAKMD